MPPLHLQLPPLEELHLLRPSGAGVRRQGDLRFMLCEASINQQSLTQFMDRLVRTSLRKVFLILDNLKGHHGKKAAARLDRHREKIELFLLAAYLRPNVISAIKPPPSCEPYNLLLIRSPLSFCMIRFPVFLFGGNTPPEVGFAPQGRGCVYLSGRPGKSGGRVLTCHCQGPLRSLGGRRLLS